MGGFISATGSSPPRKSIIDYFTPIDQSFTTFGVVREALKRSEKTTDAVGQQYVLNTFDLGSCMKALPIIWKNLQDCKRHVATPGPFPTTLNYLGMVTSHKCNGSGYSELLLKSKLATSGCLAGVLRGKAYSKTIFAFKTEKVNAEEHNPGSLIVQDCSREKNWI